MTHSSEEERKGIGYADEGGLRDEQSPPPHPPIEAIERLKEAAEKATPGPWIYDEVMEPFYNDMDGNSCGGGGAGVAEIGQEDGAGNWLFDEDGEPVMVPIYALKNARFIAQANPAFILSLISSYEERGREIERLRADVDGAHAIGRSMLYAAQASLSQAQDKLAAQAETIKSLSEALKTISAMAPKDDPGPPEYDCGNSNDVAYAAEAQMAWSIAQIALAALLSTPKGKGEA